MLKNRKASEEDEIMSECLKKGEQKMTNKFHGLIDTIILWNQEEIPKKWQMLILL